MGAPDGDCLGPYRLLSPLGAGGFGEVHLALDPEGRTVAIKILHPHVAADEGALTRLAREVEAMRRVQGPHVAEILDASLTGSRPYLATRYVQGRPLAAVVSGDGPIRGDDLVRLARGLAEALAAVHSAGVIHRDLKPGNVILTDGEPVVIDFGIACMLDSASVTTSGAVLGTPGYLAPEILEGGETGPEADVFSFAATLAFAATGRHPYGTGPASAVGYRVVHHEPDLDGVPPWLEPLLRECMVRDPAARPPASMLLARLGAAAPVVRVAAPPLPAFAAAESREPLQETAHRAPRGASRGGGVHSLTTREWRPGRGRRSGDRTPEEVRERRRAVIHRRWVVGTGLLVALTAAAAKSPLPEVSLLLLTIYGAVMLVDGGVALLARQNRPRLAVDLAGAGGSIALWFVLGAFFSPLTLGLALATVVFVLVVILLSS
ncbi:serine/threonine protein kinase [Planomonospora sp. ID67723]|uniref:serine/threonine-protein kinase n=1 Tax=Planomonospora sp. ID67723 TaxID=2738134 RepID=UPI0018C4373F|nr:serine/threonine-protein kinase [Planomonospora sp. ID67723]MBG0832258.1 serine/threonine protein kinase [Planomonospora sp. ID67723]